MQFQMKNNLILKIIKKLINKEKGEHILYMKHLVGSK